MPKQFYISVFLIILLIASCSTQRSFQKLSNKYKKARYEKVLNKADRYIKKNPADPVPLYFKSITHLHFYNEDRKPADLQKAMQYLYRARRKTIPEFLEKDINLLASNILEISKSHMDQIEQKSDPLIAQKIYQLRQKIADLPGVKIAKAVPPRRRTKSEPAPVKDIKGIRKNIIKISKKYVGTPYKYGGTNARGFDCSGFTGYVYAKAGINLPRSSGQQASAGDRIPMRKARPGDLVFFTKNKYGGGINHVAIILETDQKGIKSVIHSTSRGVVIDEREGGSWQSYWLPRKKMIASYIDD